MRNINFTFEKALILLYIFHRRRHVLSQGYMLNFAETFNSEFSHSQRDFREEPSCDRGGEVSRRNTRWRNCGRENLKFP